MKTTEHDEQVTLMQWAELMKGKYPELALFHAIPNGGRRDAVTGRRLKEEGVKAGVPDLCLPVARGGYHGLYIEMKTLKGTVQATQKWWLEQLEKQGYLTEVCRSSEEAEGVLMAYLDGLRRVGE